MKKEDKQITTDCNLSTSLLELEKYLHNNKELDLTNVLSDDAKQKKHKSIKQDDSEIDSRQEKLVKQVADLELELELQMLDSISSNGSDDNAGFKFDKC